MSLPAALLVDQDGTMVDTEPYWEESEAALLAELGGTLTPRMREQMIGGPLRRTIDVMLAAAARTRDPEQMEIDLVERVAAKIEASGPPWMPAAPDFIARTRSLGIPLALVTSAWARIARTVADGAPAGGFDLVVAGDEVDRPKPAPDAYLEAARRLGAPIGDCLVVEDSPTGIRAGLASGARVVVIPGVLPIGPSADYSRLTSLESLTATVLERLAAGERIDEFED
ncbi:HAD family phosphatase [Actinomyces sp. B33]|uniref:HAD family hydrolase n=1 Tax=Actinomyces sp. B33 TaxID=2942131 RepID=UPI00233FC5C1|nr:HAD family phosphatase [Actinomyces sp. B33]MDC4233358.1 HAD family phosphatase [Actinomyces sp. B33]